LGVFLKGACYPFVAVECSNLPPCNWQVVSPDELKEDGEYEEIVEDMREECGKYGKLVYLDEYLIECCEHK
jgi:hypothetical protein